MLQVNRKMNEGMREKGRHTHTHIYMVTHHKVVGKLILPAGSRQASNDARHSLRIHNMEETTVAGAFFCLPFSFAFALNKMHKPFY